MSDYSLEEFEEWCNGKGRGGKTSGIHWNGIDLIMRFRKFKKREKQNKLQELQKQAKIDENE